MKERKRGGRHGPSIASIKADMPIAKVASMNWEKNNLLRFTKKNGIE
jgi:hypothetical protein